MYNLSINLTGLLIVEKNIINPFVWVDIINKYTRNNHLYNILSLLTDLMKNHQYHLKMTKYHNTPNIPDIITNTLNIPKNVTKLVKSLEYDKQQYLNFIGDNLYYNLNTKKIGDGQIIWVDHKNNLYYHGAYGPIPSIEKWAGKSFTTNPIIGTEKPIIFEYNNLDKPLPNPKLFDTYNASVFCNNCSLDKEASKRKRKFKIYRCNGHSL